MMGAWYKIDVCGKSARMLAWATAKYVSTYPKYTVYSKLQLEYIAH